MKSQSSEALTAVMTLGAALELVFSQEVIRRVLPTKKHLVFCAQKEMPWYGHSLPQKKQTEKSVGSQLQPGTLQNMNR